MTRYAIVEYNTDHRDPQYDITFTRSVRKVKAALAQEPERAYPYDPGNLHRRVTIVYQLLPGYRKPTKAVLNKATHRRGSKPESALYSHILAWATQVTEI